MKRQPQKHYAYRLDHDTGFAPHVAKGICTLCGCKTTTIERWARNGSWVVGIGGNRTTKPDLLIYAMQVESTPPLSEFRRDNPDLASYLEGRGLSSGDQVLMSRQFWYFGDQAIRLPKHLQRLVIRQRGCKKLTDQEVAVLFRHLRKRRFGSHGTPNNLAIFVSGDCGCGKRP